jgi:hypothetical protein
MRKSFGPTRSGDGNWRIETNREINEVINPLKTKRICFILGLSPYRAVNTLHFGYKNQSLNVL